MILLARIFTFLATVLIMWVIIGVIVIVQDKWHTYKINKKYKNKK